MTYSIPAYAQAANENGLVPYGAYHGSELDLVSVLNGHLELRIPIKDFPQRGGKLKLTFIARYNNAIWNERKDCPPTGACFFSWQNNGGPMGVQFGAEQAPPGLTQHCIDFCNTSSPVFAYALVLADRSEHPLGNVSGTLYRTLDATGILVDIPSGNTTLPNGARYVNVFTSNPVMEDANGNQIFFGPPIGDSLGRNIPLTGSGATSDFSGCTGALPIASASLWIVPGSNGANETFKLCYASVHIFMHHFATDDSHHSEPNGPISMLQSIVLPDGTTWTFDYSQSDSNGINWGDLVKITFPTGGTISYSWGHGTGCQKLFGPPGSTSGSIGMRTIDANDGTGPHSWIYGSAGIANSRLITDPLGNDAVHTFTDLNSSCSLYETQTQDYSGSHTSGALLKTVTTDYSWSINPNSTGSGSPPMNVVPLRHTTTWPSGSVHKVEYSYDSGFLFQGFNAPNSVGIYGKQTTANEFDYGNGSPGALLKSTQTSYLWQAPAGSQYLNFNLLDVPMSVAVLDGGGNQVALTTSGYDAAVPAASGITVSHDLNPVNGNVRGNLTSVSHWLNGTAVSTTNCPVSINNGYVTEGKTYFDTGMVSQSTDACGNKSSFQYADNPYHGAYLTNSCDALNHCTAMTYNLNPGLLANMTDPNNETVGHSYDNIGRLTSISYPDGGQTNIYYPDPTTIEVKKLLNSSTNTWIDQFTYFDGIIRPKQKRLVDPAGDVYTETTYDPLGRVATVSNSHRASSTATDGITTNSYDVFGRITSVTEPDGNMIKTTYSDPGVALLTDETGRQRRKFTDALGRLIQVDEPGINLPGGNELTQPFSTFYTYDLLNNLRSVSQHGNTSDSTQWRPRSFQYDSLSRLTQSNNPEAGQINYTYDANGNVITRTDARSITVTYSYDPLNRVTQESYSNGHSSETFSYDQASAWGNTLNNPIGRLTTMFHGNTGAAFSYDALGRVSDQWSCGPHNCGTGDYHANAKYDPSGNLSALTYPSSRVVTYGYNAANRLNQVQFSQWNGGLPDTGVYTYWSAADGNFYPNGIPSLWTLASGVTESTVLNNRLQLQEEIVSLPGMGTFADHVYNYGAQNNGDILSITDKLNSSFTQSFTYDMLNRVVTASESRWGVSFVYDAWGNRLQQNVTTGTAGQSQLTVDGNNRIAGSGFTYDANGNVLSDGFHQYDIDAENQIDGVDNGASTYTYDAVGNRVRKDVNGQPSTEYVYFGGQVVAEKNTTTEGWSDYIYAGSRRLAQSTDFEDRILIQGTNCSGCGSPSTGFTINGIAWLPYAIRQGDRLMLRQKANSGLGGVILNFSDGSSTRNAATDTDGQLLNSDTMTGFWHYRQVDLSAYAGKTLSSISLISETTSGPGNWLLKYADFVLASTDGTVRPIYTNETTVNLTQFGGSGVTGISAGVDHVSNSGDPTNTTFFYHTDGIGSSRLLSANEGWPVWQGTFLPFGEEYAPQITTNHYKFSGKERGNATEGGLDYFGARYYSSLIGRWMSPDWSAKPVPIPYGKLENPQSLNLYSFVTDDPLSNTDLDGHAQYAPASEGCPGGQGDDCGASNTSADQQRAQTQTQGNEKQVNGPDASAKGEIKPIPGGISISGSAEANAFHNVTPDNGSGDSSETKIGTASANGDLSISAKGVSANVEVKIGMSNAELDTNGGGTSGAVKWDVFSASGSAGTSGASAELNAVNLSGSFSPTKGVTATGSFGVAASTELKYKDGKLTIGAQFGVGAKVTIDLGSFTIFNKSGSSGW